MNPVFFISRYGLVCTNHPQFELKTMVRIRLIRVALIIGMIGALVWYSGEHRSPPREAQNSVGNGNLSLLEVMASSIPAKTDDACGDQPASNFYVSLP